MGIGMGMGMGMGDKGGYVLHVYLLFSLESRRYFVIGMES